MNPEYQRLMDDRQKKAKWKRWGPYLSERQWGTVREDYSDDGDAWEYFPHDHARLRAYRWGEDGIAGISDSMQRLCFSIAFWNGQDHILKERLFGLTNKEGNHGEDVKEVYFYLDNTPTHSYMKYLYKYPQKAFPYSDLLARNRSRTRQDKEYELLDTGVFDDDRYFDMQVEYAKGAQDDILIRITCTNHGPETSTVHILPTLFFRNYWSWNKDTSKPKLTSVGNDKIDIIAANHLTLGDFWLYGQKSDKILFTENETNTQRLYNVKGASSYYKDGINDYVVEQKLDAVNPRNEGTKSSLQYILTIPPSRSTVLQLRLIDDGKLKDPLGKDFGDIFLQRIKEADTFYDELTPFKMTDDERNVQRQALAGMLWSKQYYNFNVHDWLEGDETMPTPSEKRRSGRDSGWEHLDSENILSMPDKWEYPWFAAWDMAFHAIALAMVDPDFAKGQLDILTREWYMHPNGQIPAYEWEFGDVNPPVHAWSALRVYRMEKKRYGQGDRKFLERVFQKLLLNFTWWVNRKDKDGKNIFQGGFLGFDNIGIFDRSAPLPTGGYLEQADGTSWMGMYSLNMLAIALELALENDVYEDIATKFFEHFIYIAEAMNKGCGGVNLWDEQDGFYYDVLRLPNGSNISLKIKSMVGLIPLCAVQTIEPDMLEALPMFKKRLDWFLKNRPSLCKNIACMETPGIGERRLLSIVDKSKLETILGKMLDENEFLSPFGIRALSKYHQVHPFVFSSGAQSFSIDYEPGESTTDLFGGNSNWRGPVWFPANFLLIESLQKFDYYYGDSFKIEYPKNSGQMKSLWEISSELSRRLTRLFLKDDKGVRPIYLEMDKFKNDPLWGSNVLFFEYFHGDTGRGVGAGHQTGWSGLVGKLIQQTSEFSETLNRREVKKVLKKKTADRSDQMLAGN